MLDSFARTGKVNPCAIRLIRVFRVLLLYGFLALARNDIACHAERSEASTHWIPRYARNDKEKARRTAQKVRMTRKTTRHDRKKCAA